MQILYWALQTLPYVVAFLAAVSLIVLFLGSYRSFGFGLALLAVTSWLDASTQSAPVLQLGVRLYVADVPLILLGAVTGLRWLVAKDVPWRHPGWVLYVLVFLGNLAWGLATQGTAAGVQARGDFYAIVAASYAMSFPMARPQVRLLVRALAWLAVGLVALTVYRWCVYYLQITDLLPPSGTYNIDGAIRVIGSPHALLLAQALLLGLYFAHISGAGGTLRVMLPLLLGLVVALQHRSVWLATMVGVGVSIVLARAERMPVWQQLAALGVLALLVVGGLSVGGRVSEEVVSSAQRAAAGEGTVRARFENWRVTLTEWQAGGPRNLLVGKPLGGDATRTVLDKDGRLVRIGFGAHNNYVSQLVGTGVLGLAGLLWALGSALRGLWRACRRSDGGDADWAALLLMLLAVQMAYYVAYAVDFMQLLVLGMAIAAVAGLRPASRPVGHPPYATYKPDPA